MKEKRINYIVDNFVDANGDERNFVIAAVSYEFDDCIDLYDMDFVQTCRKGLKVGWSICNPKDTFNRDLGIKIAIGRARKNANFALLAADERDINVQAFLKRRAKYFKNDPSSLIAGYKRGK